MNVRPNTGSSRAVSDRASTHALLNCLIKEYALPNGWIAYRWPADSRGLGELRGQQGQPLDLHWPGEHGFDCCLLVDRRAYLGQHRYLSDPYVRLSGVHEWRACSFLQLAEVLIAAVAADDGEVNAELFEQMRQSERGIAEMLAANAAVQDAPRDYLASEQRLWFGHPTHPAPKARQWPDSMNSRRYSPEFQALTPLHQFSFPREGFECRTNGLATADVEAAVGRQGVEADRVVLSMHPVQAALFKQDPRATRLLADGTCRDLGESGFSAAPTASLRTWYVKDHPYFIKGSLNVRITNCVRKNAWYEIESALVIDRLFQRLKAQRDHTLASMQLAREPASVHWAPLSGDDEERRWFTEQTGIVLRENFCVDEGESRCLMAGGLFGRDVDLSPWVGRVIGDRDPVAWFEAYLEALVMPVLSLFFRHGVVLEPHLQNCVLIHDHGWPRAVLIRDFEGTKVTAEHGARWLEEGLAPRVRESLIYPRAQGWCRVAYCLFVNHLAEAILALSWHRPALGERLWLSVHAHLVSVRRRLGVSTPELDAVIAGGAIPCKTNLKVRLMGASDRQSLYVQLPSPWRREVACA
ncbi:IucA/IucC family siderophore biosynthesis protein [Salinicola corii]|uniref:IucA/IucC family siderophore biosynthesis protein n=1 Tax=Salinicola corii TaxID=2606937 RepID=A0A640W9M8_9GAMM|nr:IucA/IucC family protein [Salinicola corii]KAA0016963.1 IucA/IucC family siderophore biosynthesis protein [Salinicola corii]